MENSSNEEIFNHMIKYHQLREIVACIMGDPDTLVTDENKFKQCTGNTVAYYYTDEYKEKLKQMYLFLNDEPN